MLPITGWLNKYDNIITPVKIQVMNYYMDSQKSWTERVAVLQPFWPCRCPLINGQCFNEASRAVWFWLDKFIVQRGSWKLEQKWASGKKQLLSPDLQETSVGVNLVRKCWPACRLSNLCQTAGRGENCKSHSALRDGLSASNRPE